MPLDRDELKRKRKCYLPDSKMQWAFMLVVTLQAIIVLTMESWVLDSI